MEVPTNPTRESAFVWICGSFLISANEIRISREDFFGSGTETHGFIAENIVFRDLFLRWWRTTFDAGTIKSRGQLQAIQARFRVRKT